MADRWTDHILGRAADDAAHLVTDVGTTAAGERAATSTGEVLSKSVNLETPLTLGPDSPMWRGPSDDPRIRKLAQELIAQQLKAQTAVGDAMLELLSSPDLRVASDVSSRAPQVIGRITNPGGSPAIGVRVSLDPDGLTAEEAARAAATTTQDGSFVIQLPVRLTDVSVGLPGLVVQGANRSVTLTTALHDVALTGVLGPIELDQPVTPLPLDFLGLLAELDGDPAEPADDGHETPTISLGDDDCSLMFRKDTSHDKFPYSVMFRLSDPSVVAPTLTFTLTPKLLEGIAKLKQARIPVFGPINPALVLAGALDEIELDLVERVPISRPLSIDGFRDGLSQPFGSTFAGTPLAGSLAIGYVVHLAQRWTPLGLALGDLVYSLPLAPGEQQRVAVVERTATSQVIDSETLETTEALAFSELDDTSADATFASAFQESASGGTHMHTTADSSSWAAAGGIGLAIGPLVLGGGGGGGSGHSESTGDTNTWMSGNKSSTSSAAETTHAATQRQASARRQAARASMRLATASETDKVVTKVITNHNKTRALTVQYWEVVRMFDVSTNVEGTSLVCLVPLDVIRFLPPGEPATLVAAPADRPSVLHRYQELITHADVLANVVPARYRQGLALVTEFAGDPQAAVQGSGGDAEDVLDLSLTGRFLPFEDLYVSVVSKRGLRTAPTPLTGTVEPLPTGQDSYASETDMLKDLRDRRASGGAGTTLQGSVVLPASIPRQDVAGFEISRRFRSLSYSFIGRAVRNLAAALELIAVTGDLTDAVAEAAAKGSGQVTYTPDQLESLLGGPPVSSFSATATGVTFAQATFPVALDLPRTAYPVSSRVVPPLLGYTSVLEIEKTLQWCVRNTMSASVAVFGSLTNEERVVMLERYEVTLPPDDDGNPRSVPLVSCITNQVLGYFGNSMVMPFQIPAEATALTATTNADGTRVPGLTTADVTDALTRFHTDGFSPPHTTIALPTKGVLGEAVLGHCPSAEKIDLTRFWNWQDSPADQATEIQPVQMPQGSLTAGLSAPSDLVGMAPMINNFSTTGVTPDTSLASALAAAAAQEQGFDIKALTNADNLATVQGKTLETAEAARKDALQQATTLATKAMDAAVKVATTKKAEDKASDSVDPLTVVFAKDKDKIEDAPAGTSAKGQTQAIKDWAAKAKAAKATAISVKGYSSTDDTASKAEDLQDGRAAALKAALEQAGLSGVTAAKGGKLSKGDAATQRKADATITEPKQGKAGGKDGKDGKDATGTGDAGDAGGASGSGGGSGGGN